LIRTRSNKQLIRAADEISFAAHRKSITYSKQNWVDFHCGMLQSRDPESWLGAPTVTPQLQPPSALLSLKKGVPFTFTDRWSKTKVLSTGRVHQNGCSSFRAIFPWMKNRLWLQKMSYYTRAQGFVNCPTIAPCLQSKLQYSIEIKKNICRKRNRNRTLLLRGNQALDSCFAAECLTRAGCCNSQGTIQNKAVFSVPYLCNSAALLIWRGLGREAAGLKL